MAVELRGVPQPSNLMNRRRPRRLAGAAPLGVLGRGRQGEACQRRRSPDSLRILEPIFDPKTRPEGAERRVDGVVSRAVKGGRASKLPQIGGIL